MADEPVLGQVRTETVRIEAQLEAQKREYDEGSANLVAHCKKNYVNVDTTAMRHE